MTVIRRTALFASLTACAAAVALALVAPPVRGDEGEERRLTLHPSIQVSAVADDNPYFQDEDGGREIEVGPP